MTSGIDAARFDTPDIHVVHLRAPKLDGNGTVTKARVGAIAMGYNGQDAAVVRLANGARRTQRVPPRTIGLTGGDPIVWLRTDRPADVVEVTASAALRKGIAAELGVEAWCDLDDRPGLACGRSAAILDRLKAAARGLSPLSQVEMDYLTRQLYGEIFCTQFGGSLRERSRAPLDKRRLGAVLCHIEANVENSITLDALAKIAGYSQFHFARAFRVATGWSPHQYVLERKLQHARLQLQIPEKTVEQIAAEVGYSNVSHFRRLFARRIGMAPSQFRQMWFAE